VNTRSLGVWKLLLLALILAVAIPSVVIVCRDHRPLIHDPLTNLLSAVALKHALAVRTAQAWIRAVACTGFRPPLPAIIYQPALHLFRRPVVAIRLTDLLLLLIALWLIFDLGQRLASPPAGLLAAVLFAAFPLTQGWSRMGNADPVIWLTLLLLVRLLLMLDPRSRRQSVAVGIVVGLCAASRLLTLAFLVGPLLWLVAIQVRDRRSIINLLVVCGCAIGTIGWWYVLQIGQVTMNVNMSLGRHLMADFEAGAHPVRYLDMGYGWVVGGALVAGIIAWRRRLLERRQLCLLGAFVLAPVLQFAFFWDYWERYPIALVSVCALLVATVFDQVVRSWRGPWRTAAWAGIYLCGLAPLALFYATGGVPSSGLMRPDPSPHNALVRALKPVPPEEPVLVLNTKTELHPLDYARAILLDRGDPRRLVEPRIAGDRCAEVQTREVWYLLRITAGTRPLDRPGEGSAHRLSSVADPNGIRFEVFQSERGLSGTWSAP
jgi:hypothetical protein